MAFSRWKNCLHGVLFELTIDNLTKDEAKALLIELEKVKDSLEKFEEIDTTIFDSIERRNKIDQQQDANKK